MEPLKLMCILSHPDDESLGMGGTLAKYAAEGVETYIVMATRGEKGWYLNPADYPGPDGLGKMREAELRAAAQILGVCRVDFLDYEDGLLDQADVHEASRKIAQLIQQVRPQVIATFGPDGDYGHPDHIAISQLTAAAIVHAASASILDAPPHTVSKLYYLANPPEFVKTIERLFGDQVGIEVDGLTRRINHWPAWAITTRIDVLPYLEVCLQAIRCHQTQLPSLGDIGRFSDDDWAGVVGEGFYYRAMSLVNGGRAIENDLFAGLR